VTTLFAVCIAAANDLRRKEDVNCFGRRLDETSIHKAFSILFIYTALLMTGTAVITLAEPVSLIRAMFECASALGTVGLTTGITPGLGPVSKAILILFMYFGRVGGLTIVYAAVSKKKRPIRKYPMEKIAVG
jgi:trk system potassium uptake protein TrkH